MLKAVVLFLLPALMMMVAGDCFTSAVGSTADCFLAITCDAPKTISKQVESCRKAFNSGIVKSSCSEQATSTPPSTISIIKALIISSEPNQCTAGVKFPLEDLATALRQQIAAVDAQEAAAGVADDGVVLGKKQKAAKNPLLITDSDNGESADELPATTAKASKKDLSEVNSAIKTMVQDSSSGSESGARSVASKPGFGSFLKKVGGVAGGIAGGIAGGVVRSNPLVNVAGALAPQQQQQQQQQQNAAPGPVKKGAATPDDEAAAAVANAGAAVASAGAVIAKSSAEGNDAKAEEKPGKIEEKLGKIEEKLEKTEEKHQAVTDSKAKPKELVAVAHNGRVTKVVDVSEDSAPKAKVINVEDDSSEQDVGERGAVKRAHSHGDPDNVMDDQPRLKTVNVPPSVIVDSRGRFSIPEDQLESPKKRTTVPEVVSATNTKDGVVSSGLTPTSAPTNSSTPAPGVVVNVDRGEQSTSTNWLAIGLLSGLGLLIIIGVFVLIRRISSAIT